MKDKIKQNILNKKEDDMEKNNSDKNLTQQYFLSRYSVVVDHTYKQLSTSITTLSLLVTAYYISIKFLIHSPSSESHHFSNGMFIIALVLGVTSMIYALLGVDRRSITQIAPLFPDLVTSSNNDNEETKYKLEEIDKQLVKNEISSRVSSTLQIASLSFAVISIIMNILSLGTFIFLCAGVAFSFLLGSLSKSHYKKGGN